MQRSKKLLLVALACAGMTMALLVAIVVVTHLMANRQVVKTYISAKTTQITGGTLDYERLTIGFLPMPHVEVRGIHLHHLDHFSIRAKELSVYVEFLPLLRREVRIRQLALLSPDMKIHHQPASESALHPTSPMDFSSLSKPLASAIQGIFGAMAKIDPGMDVRIDDGKLTLMTQKAGEFALSAIDATLKNDGDHLLLAMEGRSDLVDEISVSADADIASLSATGEISVTGLDLSKLTENEDIFGDVGTANGQATVKTDFSIHGPNTVQGRLDVRLPTLSVKHKYRFLEIQQVVVSGGYDLTDQGLLVTLDKIQSSEPALDLSANATLGSSEDKDPTTLVFRAAADRLDVAVAGKVTRDLLGDLDSIQTAFSVVKEGILTDVTYFAKFASEDDGWKKTTMRASCHLTHGLITIEEIASNIEQLAGDVIYEDNQVTFSDASGRFNGADFAKLEGAIHWEGASTFSIASPDVNVDLETLLNWLTSFEAIAGFKENVASFSGFGQLSSLKISGPLTKPQNWSFEISGTPNQVRMSTPLVSFPIIFSGGQVTYIPDHERALGVGVTFLDGSFVTSYQSKGIVHPETAAWRIDGTMGQATVAWLSTILPIPDHLQLKPPVTLNGVNIVKHDNQTYSFLGELKTAGGVTLAADVNYASGKWHFRDIRFSDGHSKAAISGRQMDRGFEMTFAGNVEKKTADRLLKDNSVLSGQVAGNFSATIDSEAPRNSSLSGVISGTGVHLFPPGLDRVDINHFYLKGDESRLNIESSEITICDSLLVVDGFFARALSGITFDLDVDTDRISEQLIELFTTMGAKKPEETGAPETDTSVVTHGKVRVRAADLSYAGHTWKDIESEVRVDGKVTEIQVKRADLCGIATTGQIGFSPQGFSVHMTPSTTGTSLEETFLCLLQYPIEAEAQYDLTGYIDLPPTHEFSPQFMTGELTISSENGRIVYATVLMKVFSILNITEIFTGGKSDLAEEGFGYARIRAKTRIGGGKLVFDEILLDGNAITITGQGSIDLADQEMDISLLAAPLKTVDRIVNKLPIIGYIAGGSLISVPLHIGGTIDNPDVVPMSPKAVGKGLLGIMERTLKSPFKLVESAAELATGESKTMAAPTNKKDFQNHRGGP